MAAASRPDDRFIPLRREDLAAAIADDHTTFGDFAKRAAPLTEAVCRSIARDLDDIEVTLERQYAAFDPDRETIQLKPDPQPADADEFLAGLEHLLDKANFERLSDPQVDEAVAAANSQGLRVTVDPDAIEWVHLYVRGRGEIIRERFNWRKPRTPRRVVFKTYSRLVVIAQLKDEPDIRLKLYRDIPIVDVEALLPHARVSMSRLDQVQVFGASAGALGGLGTKLFGAAAGGALVVSSLLWAAVIAFGGLAFRSFMGWHRTKKKRDSQRTQHLFSQLVASNAAVIHRLAFFVRQEDTKEALLALAFKAVLGEHATPAAIDAAAEAWLRQRFGLHVNFDCPDALATVDRLSITESPADEPSPARATPR
ncbi:MAG: DUF3754 domain-containing protein [Planctomycetota bacterium]